ncbi:MAG TPA: aminotransferase class III-fold pyridoxal phosphate-dependent enzyme [Acidimicrobiia bacterium]
MSAFWHPFADMHTVQHAPFIVDRAEGVYVYDEEGERYLDAIAGLWYANIGHGRREVVEAVYRQMEKLPAFHCFVDFGTRPTIELADRIAAVSPDPGSKVFFGQGGSDAVDTAAKLARRYFSAIGQPERTVFIAREWGYHGVNTYGTSLAGIEPNRAGYGELVGDVVIVPYDDAEAVAKAIEHAGPERIAGIFVEAVVGAGGVRPVPESYLRQVREAVRQAGGLYISDEVITGFGRVGDWFAANRFDLEPDMITFAKGVTCGYLPLGGVVVAPRVAGPFFDEPGNIFRHGYTYSGHAASCAAGLAVMDILENEGVIQRAAELETEIPAALAPLTDLDAVTEIRAGVGALAAIQLDTEDDTLAPRAAKACREAGVLTRVVGGGALQVSPPLVMTPEEVTEMAERFHAGLATL